MLDTLSFLVSFINKYSMIVEILYSGVWFLSNPVVHVLMLRYLFTQGVALYFAS
jgi:hypothetical protein